MYWLQHLIIVSSVAMHYPNRFGPLGTCSEQVYDEFGHLMPQPWPDTHDDRRDFEVSWKQLRRAIERVVTCPEAVGEPTLGWTDRCLQSHRRHRPGDGFRQQEADLE